MEKGVKICSNWNRKPLQFITLHWCPATSPTLISNSLPPQTTGQETLHHQNMPPKKVVLHKAKGLKPKLSKTNSLTTLSRGESRKVKWSLLPNDINDYMCHGTYSLPLQIWDSFIPVYSIICWHLGPWSVWHVLGPFLLTSKLEYEGVRAVAENASDLCTSLQSSSSFQGGKEWAHENTRGPYRVDRPRVRLWLTGYTVMKPMGGNSRSGLAVFSLPIPFVFAYVIHMMRLNCPKKNSLQD